jgi:hypothetical protein
VQPVEWPNRKCRQTVWRGDTALSCEVIDTHPGPCASFSDQASIDRRDAWEQDNPNWKSDMREEGGAFE